MAQPGPRQEFANSPEALDQAVRRAREERRKAGLDGLVGPLAAVYVNTEPAAQREAVEELLRCTGLDLDAVYEGPNYITAVLKASGSADVIVRSRRTSDNPFLAFNERPKSWQVPNTRLETLLFETSDLDRYVAIQKGRGAAFLTPEPVRTEKYSFIQTAPSIYTGTSTALIQWTRRRGDRHCSDMVRLDWPLRKPANSYSGNVRQLDHVAIRVRAQDRDPAILELMALTNYDFDRAFYVEGLNSITNVTRQGKDDPAIVVTSGISPFTNDERSGPTEEFVHNYGPRTHHLAFWTEDIEATFAAAKADGQQFLIELVGSLQEGLKQTFTQPSPHTLLVHEYIFRYGDFDGFFTKSNVTALTQATQKQ